MRLDRSTHGKASSAVRASPSALCAAFAIGLAACGGGGGGSGSGGGPSADAPPPPTGVTAQSLAGAPDDVRLSWTAPAAAIDGYLVELKIGTAAFQPQNDMGSLVPRDWTGMLVTLAPGAPDLVDYVVRMRSVRAGVASVYSNQAVYHRPLNPPKNVVARFDWARGAPVVEWERNSTGSTSAAVERCEVTNSFPVWTTLAVVDPTPAAFVDDTAVTDHSYRYRVSNVAGAVTVASASSADVYTGLAPPAPAFIRFDTAQQAVVLSIQGANPAADGLRLERQLVDASYAAIGPWETVDVGTGVPLSFSDATWPENATLKYRVSNLRGTYASPPAVWAQAVSTPLYRPAALAATSAGGTITLSWENRSAVAAQVEISWSPALGEIGVRSVLATLAPTATTYDVTTLGLGYYRFTVAAQTASRSGSAFVDYTTPNPPGALSLSGGALAANDATDAALRPDGTWAFLTRGATSLSVSAPGEPWPAVQRTDVVASALSGTAPVLASDGDGRPHVVYLASAPDGGDPILTHLWWNGAAWTAEAMYRGPLSTGHGTPAFLAALDATATPQALVVVDSGPSTCSARLVRKGDAGWTSEALALPAFDLGLDRLVAFGLDTAGNPHFTLNRTEWARSDAGDWSASVLTPISGVGEPHAPQDAAWIDAQNAVVLVFGIVTTSTSAFEVGVVEKIAGAWQPLRILGRDRRTYGVSPPMRLAATSDRARVAILHGTEVGVRAYARDAGAWSTTLVAPPQTQPTTPGATWPSGFFRAGFDAGGKARFLVREVPSADGYLDAYEP